MKKNYADLAERAKKRSNPESIRETILFSSEETRGLGMPYSEVLIYIKNAMLGVEPEYTDRTIEAGNKIKEHLKRKNPNLDYKFQGSVMCNTHIKGHSDIDLVQITNSFYSHESKIKFEERYNSDYALTNTQKQNLLTVINGTPFLDDVNSDLRSIRINAENVLINIYKNVDIKKGKSIEVNPTNPDRIVDVVTASWYESIDSVLNKDIELKGIQVYDKIKNIRLKVDFPFLKIRLLNEKDRNVNGRLKKMIRFLKTLKADSNYEMKDISSFDISSICYNIPELKYNNKPYYELVIILYLEFKKIIDDDNYRNSILSIDNTEHIFKNKDEKVYVLKLLFNELQTIYSDLMPMTSTIKIL